MILKRPWTPGRGTCRQVSDTLDDSYNKLMKRSASL